MSVAVMGLVAAVLFGGVVAGLVYAGYPYARGWLDRLPASLRTRLLFALLAAPVIAGAALSLLAMLPGLVAALAPAFDHCPHHDDNHFHLCVVHAPAVVHFGRAWLVVALVVAPVILRMTTATKRLLQGRRVLLALRRSARASGAGYEEVASETPFAVTAGLWRPRVYVTTRLLRELDPSSQATVLAHEAAHVRRRDPLTKLLAELLGAFHLAKTRRTLLADLSLACEQASDEEAAAAVGDRTTVADTLVRLGRLVSDASRQVPSAATSFGESHIAARVHSLLQAPKHAPHLPSAVLTGASSVVLGLVLCSPLHHATETVLGTFFG